MRYPTLSAVQVAISGFTARILGIDSTATDFSAPLMPFRIIHQNVSWGANDPLVHYTVPDLVDLLGTTVPFEFDYHTANSPLAGVGRLNQHYRPWGGNPLVFGETEPPSNFEMTLKDSALSRSDGWTFPTNGYPDLTWIGRVHRGTPWQTLYLKAGSVDANLWQKWVGISDAAEAARLQPTNDWRLASLLASLLSTNSPQELASANQPTAEAWRSVLNGLPVLTNSGPSQFTILTMTSNSPQAALIADALLGAIVSSPNHYFNDPGDLFAVPELSTNSPWLNVTGGIYAGISDEAYEKIPSELLTLLRADSIGSLGSSNGVMHVQFTGLDDYLYQVQVSSNLVNWETIFTCSPTNGLIDVPQALPALSSPVFYRSAQLP